MWWRSTPSATVAANVLACSSLASPPLSLEAASGWSVGRRTHGVVLPASGCCGRRRATRLSPAVPTVDEAGPLPQLAGREAAVTAEAVVAAALSYGRLSCSRGRCQR